jgi:hypothetical protein
LAGNDGVTVRCCAGAADEAGLADGGAAALGALAKARAARELLMCRCETRGAAEAARERSERRCAALRSGVAAAMATDGVQRLRGVLCCSAKGALVA